MILQHMALAALGLLPQQLLQLLLKRLNILKLPVDAGKADVGDFVEVAEAVHDALA